MTTTTTSERPTSVDGFAVGDEVTFKRDGIGVVYCRIGSFWRAGNQPWQGLDGAGELMAALYDADGDPWGEPVANLHKVEWTGRIGILVDGDVHCWHPVFWCGNRKLHKPHGQRYPHGNSVCDGVERER